MDNLASSDFYFSTALTQSASIAPIAHLDAKRRILSCFVG
jgi:hypothetical protein